ncbi:MAG: four helix bundle suffix domain-containing protein [Bacteroidales bacterium]|nr:four helix bundle suffix domain-containing protein [Candidatus Liminaster caballi]
METPKPFLPKKGNYKGLIAYQKAEIIYDITFFFANKFFDKKDRTIDQMVQAARSGKQNIAEGSAAGATSSETEIKLTNVARASLQELLDDFEDYLRVRGLEQWSLRDERTRQTQAFCNTHNNSSDYLSVLQNRSDETIANIAITLIHQEDVMLRKLLERLQKDFMELGGIKEQMTAARLGFRHGQKEEIEQLTNQNNRLLQRVKYLEELLTKAGISY